MQQIEVILIEKVPTLGNLGDVVKVKAGYARNYLIPKRFARRATTAVIKQFEAQRAELEKASAQKLADAQGLATKLNGLILNLTQKAGVDGRLFGSVTNLDIADALHKKGFTTLHKSQIRMPDGHFKLVGEYTVIVSFHAEVQEEVKVVVVGEAG
jgi:large subunit ribosomal protein L9